MEEKYESIYPIEFAPGWNANVVIQRNKAGVFAITQLTVEAKSPEAFAEGLTVQNLRSLRLTDLITSALDDAQHVEFELLAGSNYDWAEMQRETWWKEVEEEWVNKGRHGFDPSLYAKTAFFYILETRSNPTSPLMSLAEKLKIPRDQLAKRIDKARQLEILTRPSSAGSFHTGKASGSLTNKGYELLGISIEE